MQELSSNTGQLSQTDRPMQANTALRALEPDHCESTLLSPQDLFNELLRLRVEDLTFRRRRGSGQVWDERLCGSAGRPRWRRSERRQQGSEEFGELVAAGPFSDDGKERRVPLGLVIGWLEAEEQVLQLVCRILSIRVRSGCIPGTAAVFPGLAVKGQGGRPGGASLAVQLIAEAFDVVHGVYNDNCVLCDEPLRSGQQSCAMFFFFHCIYRTRECE